MSTDNREQLFPDVIEHYGPTPTPADDAHLSSGLDFPIPAETFADTTHATMSEHARAHSAGHQITSTASDLGPIDEASIIQDILEPIDPQLIQAALQPISEQSVIQTELEPITLDDIAAEASQIADAAPTGYSDQYTESRQLTGYPDNLHAGEDAELTPIDPYPDAPDWVRAHIPREPLITPEAPRGGFRLLIDRMRAPKAPPAPPMPPADVPPSVPAGSDGGDDGGAGPTKRSRSSAPFIGLGVAAVSVFAAGAVVAFTGNDGDTPVPPLPTSAASASAHADATSEAAEADAAAPTWCTATTAPDRTVGNGPGGRDTGPTVIQAFEHAYYVQRSAAAAASLMVLPRPVTEIQSFIDAVPAGTEHCVTILPTPDPNRWSVDILLRIPPVGSEGIHKQWITTTPADGGLKIATVEDRK
ncbi:hypothetical protein [Rhodococcus triatomae]